MSEKHVGGLRKPELVRPFQVLTVITAVLVLLQAILAGQFLSKFDSDVLKVHEIAANLVFVAGAVQLVLVYLIRFPGKTGRGLVLTSAALVLLIFVQIGLGYSARDSVDAKAWHIPLGVLLFGLSVAIATFASRPASDA